MVYNITSATNYTHVTETKLEFCPKNLRILVGNNIVRKLILEILYHQRFSSFHGCNGKLEISVLLDTSTLLQLPVLFENKRAVFYIDNVNGKRHRFRLACLAPVTHFSALGAGCMYSHAWHWLHVLPRLAPVTCSPALGTG